jgi:putative oxidoreductase
MSKESSQGRRRAAVIAIWTVTVLLALEFVLAGGGKFSTGGGWQREFIRWGLPAWFVPVVGAIEVGSALLILIPRFAALGAASLAVTMLGATATHAIHSEWNRVVTTLILCILSLIVLRRRGVDLRLPGRA